MNKVELILLVLFLFATGMNMTISRHVFFPVSTGLLLACLYFYFSFLLFNSIPITGIFKKENYAGIKPLRVVGTIVIGFVYGTAVMSILFKIMSWPGSRIMLILACFGLIISGVIILIRQSRTTNRSFHGRLPWRNIVLIAICGILIGLSTLPVEQQRKIFNTLQTTGA